MRAYMACMHTYRGMHAYTTSEQAYYADETARCPHSEVQSRHKLSHNFINATCHHVDSKSMKGAQQTSARNLNFGLYSKHAAMQWKGAFQAGARGINFN